MPHTSVPTPAEGTPRATQIAPVVPADKTTRDNTPRDSADKTSTFGVFHFFAGLGIARRTSVLNLHVRGATADSGADPAAVLDVLGGLGHCGQTSGITGVLAESARSSCAMHQAAAGNTQSSFQLRVVGEADAFFGQRGELGIELSKQLLALGKKLG